VTSLKTVELTTTECIEKLKADSRGRNDARQGDKEHSMPDLPSHHDTGPGVSDPPIAASSRRRRVLIVVAVVALLVLFAVLHLTGVVGGESHG
jgi:hypothetical protein